MFLQEGCESFWDFGLEKPWRAWSLRSCSPGAWKKVQEGTPGGLVCVVSNENVCFPTQRTKIFSLFFSRNLQCLVCILHIQHILPTQPILIASTLYWLVATTSNDWRCINVIDLFKSRSMTLVFPGLSCSTFRFLSFLFVCLFLLHWKQWLVLCVVSSHRNLDCT